MLRKSVVAAALLAAFSVVPAAAAERSASLPADFHDLGRAPASTPIHIALTLAYRNQGELDALVAQQADRQSPLFRHFLTNRQFNDAFAPSVQTYATIAAILRDAGFTVTQTFANRTMLDAVAPAGAVERFFATEIHRGIQDGHGFRHAPAGPGTLPIALRESVIAFAGLDNRVTLAPRYKLREIKGPRDGYGPQDFETGYDEPILHGYDGTGRSIANVMAGDISDSDLATYLSHFNVTPAYGLIRVPVDGGNLGYYDVETTLDVEMMTSTAPGAQVYLYSFPDFTDAYAEDAYNQIVSDNLVDAANSSWGGCETDKQGALGYYFARASNRIFEQGAAKGITFPIATGDQGSRTCINGGKVDETTADSDPYALAVGGTTLQLAPDGRYVLEIGWNGSAGGVSVIFKRPAYQKNVPNVISTGRNIPDVSMDADPNTGMAEYLDGYWFVVGGTSMASPMWVGLEGQFDQYLGTRIGFVNPELFTLLQSKAYRAFFHDQTIGDNGGYRDLTGFDDVTGIGSPIGWPLAHGGV